MGDKRMTIINPFHPRESIFQIIMIRNIPKDDLCAQTFQSLYFFASRTDQNPDRITFIEELNGSRETRFTCRRCN